jgi:hypothetical protein
MEMRGLPYTPTPLPPGKEPPEPTEYEAGWAHIWSGHFNKETNLSDYEDNSVSSFIRLLANRYGLQEASS